MNVMYLTSRTESTVQKLIINTGNKSFTKSIEIGGSERSNVTQDSAANTDESSSINIFRPKGLDVSNDRVWTGGEKVSIQEYNISSDRIRWVDEMGTSKLNRINGAKVAISSVVQDSTLLQGAKFGFGYWNSEENFQFHVGKPNACGTNKENMLVMQMNQLIKVMPTKRVMIIANIMIIG